MNITKEEIRQVLDAITGPIYGALVFGEPVKAAIALLQSKLAEEDAEPVAWMRPSKEGYDSAFRDASTVALCRSTERGGWSHWDEWVPLFTHPAKPWVGLTFDDETACLTAGNTGGWKGVMKATEAKLKEKNT